MSDREALLAEADELIALTCANRFTTDRPFRESRHVIADALQRQRDGAEEACIRAACGLCEDGHTPSFYHSSVTGVPVWKHVDATRQDEIIRCNATDTYELRRRRGEGGSNAE